jgi:predicted nucleic acid-binding protein
MAFCMPLFAGRDEILVPSIFDVEVISALVRRGVDPIRVDTFLRQHLASRTLVTLGPRAVTAAAALAGRAKLRAADLLYVWVAAKNGLSLVTLDHEIVAKAAAVGVTAFEP